MLKHATALESFGGSVAQKESLMSISTTHHLAPMSPASGGPAHRSLRSAAVSLAVGAALLGAGAFAGTHFNAGAAPAVPSQEAPAPLMKRVIDPASLPGFSLLVDPATIRGAAAWAAGDGAARSQHETARLRSFGFVEGLNEQLRSTNATQASLTSAVEEFRAPTGAYEELQHQYAVLRTQRGVSLKTFPVVGIPGARGVSMTTSHGTRLEVLFPAGRYLYTASAFPGRNGVPVLTPSRLSAEAGALYLTINGCARSR
jgi:hypothetical protein